MRPRLCQARSFHNLTRIREVSHKVACEVIRVASNQGLCDPIEEQQLEERVRAAMWYPEYLPVRYEP